MTAPDSAETRAWPAPIWRFSAVVPVEAGDGELALAASAAAVAATTPAAIATSNAKQAAKVGPARWCCRLFGLDN